MDRYARSHPESLHSLTGVSLPLFSRIHRVAALHRQRRAFGPMALWTDDQLLDHVQAASVIEEELMEDKRHLDRILHGTSVEKLR